MGAYQAGGMSAAVGTATGGSVAHPDIRDKPASARIDREKRMFKKVTRVVALGSTTWWQHFLEVYDTKESKALVMSRL
jgi:hypothetical protein